MDRTTFRLIFSATRRARWIMPAAPAVSTNFVSLGPVIQNPARPDRYVATAVVGFRAIASGGWVARGDEPCQWEVAWFGDTHFRGRAELASRRDARFGANDCEAAMVAKPAAERGPKWRRATVADMRACRLFARSLGFRPAWG